MRHPLVNEISQDGLARAHKNQKSPHPPFVLPRRLSSLLEASLHESDILIISSPPGFGKTLLTLSFLEKTQKSYMFVSLNDRDSLFAPWQSKLRDNPDAFPLSTFIGHQSRESFYGFMSMCHCKRFYVVLNAWFKEVPDEQILQVFKACHAFLSHGIKIILLVNACCEERTMDLGRDMRMKLINLDDLSLTYDDLVSINKGSRKAMTEKELSSVYAYYGGWPAGVMTSLSVPDPEVSAQLITHFLDNHFERLNRMVKRSLIIQAITWEDPAIGHMIHEFLRSDVFRAPLLSQQSSHLEHKGDLLPVYRDYLTQKMVHCFNDIEIMHIMEFMARQCDTSSVVSLAHVCRQSGSPVCLRHCCQTILSRGSQGVRIWQVMKDELSDCLIARDCLNFFYDLERINDASSAMDYLNNLQYTEENEKAVIVWAKLVDLYFYEDVDFDFSFLNNIISKYFDFIEENKDVLWKQYIIARLQTCLMMYHPQDDALFSLGSLEKSVSAITNTVDLESFLVGFMALFTLVQGDVSQAEKFAQSLKSLPPDELHWLSRVIQHELFEPSEMRTNEWSLGLTGDGRQSWFGMVLKGWRMCRDVDHLSQDPESHLNHAWQCLSITDRKGLGLLSGTFRLAAGIANLKLAHIHDGQNHLEKAEACASSFDLPLLQHDVLWAKAFLKRSRCQPCGHLVSKALQYRDRNGISLPPPLPTADLEEVCKHALLENGEMDELIRFMRERNLQPGIRGTLCDRWPWKMKIYALGRFAWIVDGVQISSAHSASRRPLELLKALIAFGGQNVNKWQLIDSLWPETEGDVGLQALHTNVHRLRKLAHCRDFVSFNDGHVSLNTRHCWVDIWAFEQAFAHGERLVQAGEKDGELYLTRCIDIYRGSFLSSDIDPWIEPKRRSLLSKFIRCVHILCKCFESEGDFEKAKQLYSKGLECDECIEEFYVGLMRCALRQGYFLDGMSVYNRYRHVLFLRLGLPPSPVVERLHAQILSMRTPGPVRTCSEKNEISSSSQTHQHKKGSDARP